MNMRDRHNRSSLLAASSGGYAEVVQQLLEKGADPYGEESKGSHTRVEADRVKQEERSATPTGVKTEVKEEVKSSVKSEVKVECSTAVKAEEREAAVKREVKKEMKLD